MMAGVLGGQEVPGVVYARYWYWLVLVVSKSQTTCYLCHPRPFPAPKHSSQPDQWRPGETATVRRDLKRLRIMAWPNPSRWHTKTLPLRVCCVKCAICVSHVHLQSQLDHEYIPTWTRQQTPSSSKFASLQACKVRRGGRGTGDRPAAEVAEGVRH